ncbi:uncharacterized protein LOC108632119 [Ceratina calcarata]|uniref:Uncharacterized protein LOC108632119 n=1 Tax=Ceratina calcarata TaxID=156304 RepID=A0AAJ7JF68_9HYME|nr:uncharacterized protein LOC108632119 [Ceratina calcarata]
MKTQKCCTHCPGKLVAPRSDDFHECCQPRYVSGNLRISSMKKHVTDHHERKETAKDVALPLSERRPTCYDHFAIAKKLHAENLEHQPLPDKVDDSVFKRPEGCCCDLSSKKCCDCCMKEVEARYANLSKRCEPALGCKEPKSKMDLAICWETPIDPVYESPKPVHIDGSDGGLAPAIFTLVQHDSLAKATIHSGTARSNNGRSISCQDQSRQANDTRVDENREEHKRSAKCCCDCLCKGLNGVNISKKSEMKEQPRRAPFRKCIACGTKNMGDDPRLIKSAVGLALGTEKPGNIQDKGANKMMVPKPRTPFAKRSFCIDTLAPPFNVVNKTRDADFPEHWRLMSVYQQSYKNPYRRRNYRY